MFTSYWKTITKTGSEQTYKEPLKEEAVYAGVLRAVRNFWRFKNGRNGRASQPPLAPAAAGRKTHRFCDSLRYFAFKDDRFAKTGSGQTERKSTQTE
jgi:hypothetical protein